MVAGVLNDQVTDPAHARFRNLRPTRATMHETQHLTQLRITAPVDEMDEDGPGDADEHQSQAEIQPAG